MIDQIELAQFVDYVANSLCFAPTRLLGSQKNYPCGGSLILPCFYTSTSKNWQGLADYGS